MNPATDDPGADVESAAYAASVLLGRLERESRPDPPPELVLMKKWLAQLARS